MGEHSARRGPGQCRAPLRQARRAPVVLCCRCFALSGCGDSMPKLQDLNPFAEKEVPLRGQAHVRASSRRTSPPILSPPSRPIVLPPPQANDAWSQPGGVASNAPGHLALSGSAQIGVERQRRHRLQLLRQADGEPHRLRRQGVHARRGRQGDGRQRLGRLGRVAGLHHAAQREGPGRLRRRSGGRRRAHLCGDRLRHRAWRSTPRAGKKLWEKNLGSPLRASPTAVAERVFVVTKEGQVFCLSGSDGTELWNFRGMPERASILVNTSPAVDGDMVVVPYPTRRLSSRCAPPTASRCGRNRWRGRARPRRSSAMSDAARPVIYGGVVYAVGHAGRMMATSQKTGERALVADALPASSRPGWRATACSWSIPSGQLLADHPQRRQDPDGPPSCR